MKHAIFLVVVAACTSPSVPAKPSYADDVAPILEANCVRCHAGTAIESPMHPLINCVRLDQWDSSPDTAGACTDTGNAGMVFGVHDATRMLMSPYDLISEVTSKAMPISGPALTDRQLEILTRWRDAGYPKSSTNQPPTIEFVTPPATGVTVCNPNCMYGVQYVVADPDGDAVTWSLAWSGNGKMGTLATGLAAGSGTVTIDASPMPSGTYTLTATLDDGSSQVMVSAPGQLTVPAGHNAAPTVTMSAPAAGASFYQGKPVTITWTGVDADDATLSCDVVAVQGATTTTIQAAVVSTVGQPMTITWPAPSVTALTSYTLKVTCTDGGTPALSASAQVSIAVSPPPQNVSFSSQLQPIFTASCATSLCHAGAHPQAGLDLSAGVAYANLVNQPSTVATCSGFMLVLPGQPDQSVLIFKLQGSGACFSGSQMPKGKPPLSSTQIQLFRDWIANNAPNN